MTDEVKLLVERLREKLEKVVHPNGIEWNLPWCVVPEGGKPYISGAKSGCLFRGSIGTWADAELAVAAVNALPELLALIERLFPPLDGEGVIQADIDRAIEEADRIFVANSDVLCEADIHTIERNLAQAFAAHRRAALTPSSRAGRPVPDHASGPSEIVDFDNGEAGTR